ncbi:MAG: CDP-alcohol phosphatidyltransferase family protein, partial [Alphaproteobacteria bacterium]|nr:CDP-alcohol phosphatidyltransferase family protein [Alphaproteobacteria bacterium]
MLDHIVRPWIDPPLNRAGRMLADAGVSANAVTLSGFAVGLVAIPAIGTGHYLVGLALLLANRLSDGLDGAVARVRGPTDLGGYLDIVCDFILYSGWA